VTSCAYIPEKRGNISICNSIRTGSGVHPASNLICGGGASEMAKRSEPETEHSPSYSAKVKKMCEADTSLPNTSSMLGT
jgi:hypothetical protein